MIQVTTRQFISKELGLTWQKAYIDHNGYTARSVFCYLCDINAN